MSVPPIADSCKKASPLREAAKVTRIGATASAPTIIREPFMRWSFRIARIAGIDLRVHITFFLIVILGASQWSGFGPRGMLFGTALILLLFLCVTLHELGHSLVAQRFGVTVKEIILLPIGGVAMLSRIPSKPAQELLIAIAGPLVNVVIAAAIVLGIGVNTAMGRMDLNDLVFQSHAAPSTFLMLKFILNANIALVLFNMIPAFPLDGGRVLRAILAMRMGHVRATQVSASIGQFIAILLGLYGLIGGGALLVIIAAFIFFAAGAENVEGQTRTVLASHRVGDAYNRHALTLSPNDHAGQVVQYILNSYQPDFAVLDGHDILGVVTRDDVIRSLAHHDGDAPVTQIMKPAAVRAQADQTLDEVRQAMSDHSARVAAIYDGARYLGLVSAEDISEAFALLRFFDNRSAPKTSGQEIVV
jgi:Zn-dependent protease